MRAPALILSALLCAAAPTLAAPLVDDAIPPESVAVVGMPDAVSFEAGPDVPAPAPPPLLPRTPALTADSLVLPEEGDDAEGGPIDSGTYEQELDEVLQIDAGLAPAPDLVPLDAD